MSNGSIFLLICLWLIAMIFGSFYALKAHSKARGKKLKEIKEQNENDKNMEDETNKQP